MTTHIRSWLYNAYPNEEVNHEEDIEGQINLLSCTFRPWCTGFHALAHERKKTFTRSCVLETTAKTTNKTTK